MLWLSLLLIHLVKILENEYLDLFTKKQRY